jgi:DNA-binding MarR family transcriptional regulator
MKGQVMPRTVIRHESEHLYADQPRTDAGRSLSAAILHLRRAEQLQAERAVRASRLSSLDLTALRYLVQGYRDHKDLSPKDVIVMLDTSSATVTNVIERLVEHGYLVRVDHPTDRRAHYLVPTADAIQLVESVYGAHHSALVAVIDQLTPAEAETSAKVVTRIAEALDALADSERV